ncbi:NgoFVII family restriction endonuclease [Pseudogracilibacillus sp. SE30717A]|uniref:restriction endonuclease PLD domain-containing protein n=1 Tax=Pseudogracilibacillus sp. SE30717A TaxID=3098293 RepID=UPI00300DF169
MDFLYSNYSPLKTAYRSFSDEFYSLLSESTALDIAVGYITADSLVELKKTVELNPSLDRVRLIIGMQYIEKFTELEYKSALDLNEFLQSMKKGAVKLVTPFRFHGKLYSYELNGSPFAGIIGSNNLSSIVESYNRVYEASVLFKNKRDAGKLRGFIDDLDSNATEFIDRLKIHDFKKNNPLLENHEHVYPVSESELNRIQNRLTSYSFRIPLKDTPKSNLNVFFGKGRVSKNGLIKPRHWYEVELIVPKHIAIQDGYPVSKTDTAEFDVITDDGWKFKCKVSGDYNKNFRSAADLKILGKWIKGRLENVGALKVGELVTQDVFQKYGRRDFTLTKTTDSNLWYLDFGVEK